MPGAAINRRPTILMAMTPINHFVPMCIALALRLGFQLGFRTTAFQRLRNCLRFGCAFCHGVGCGGAAITSHDIHACGQARRRLAVADSAAEIDRFLYRRQSGNHGGGSSGASGRSFSRSSCPGCRRSHHRSAIRSRSTSRRRRGSNHHRCARCTGCMNRFRIRIRVRCRLDRWDSAQHNLGFLRFGILMADFRTKQRPRNKRSACQRNRSTSKLLAMIVISRRCFHMPVVGRGERLEREGCRLGGLRYCIDGSRGNPSALLGVIDFIAAFELAPETARCIREPIVAKRKRADICREETSRVKRYFVFSQDRTRAG